MHPFVIGELLLGRVPRIAEMMADLKSVRSANVASSDEVLEFIARRKLPGSDIGYYVDAHLLAAAALTPEVTVWTRDKRLQAAAQLLGLEVRLPELCMFSLDGEIRD